MRIAIKKRLIIGINIILLFLVLYLHLVTTLTLVNDLDGMTNIFASYESLWLTIGNNTGSSVGLFDLVLISIISLIVINFILFIIEKD